MTKPFFVTTPIYYVNTAPHIGSAYSTVAADVLARFKKQRGPVSFLVGTDEHGAKIAEAARKAGKEPKAYADEIAEEFRSAWELLDIRYDRFIRTTDADHEATVGAFLKKIYDAGWITQGVYEGLYCVGHEKFMSPEELADGKCPDHGTVPQPYKEENYFFQLSKFEHELARLIESNELEIAPAERRNEILGKLRQGLEDISISRKSVEWGIPTPWDKTHTIYVWIDALINYYTFGKPKDLWPADLHLVGKDILWFHAVIWPAMLLAAGEALPKKIFAHGFFSIGGQKMSKTLGNVITPRELVERFRRDGARYLLLSQFPFGTDGDFDWARLIEKYNSDLANGIGNLAARVTTIGVKHMGMILGIDEVLNQDIRPLRTTYEAAMETLDFYGAIGVIQELVHRADQYVNSQRIWELKDEAQREAIRNALGMLAGVAGFSAPFMPETAEKIFASLGLSGEPGEWGKAELKISKIAPLFPRLS